MLESQRLCGDSACATWVQELCKGDDQVNSEDEQIAHGVHATTAGIESKTAQHSPLALNSQIRISHPTPIAHVPDG